MEMPSASSRWRWVDKGVHKPINNPYRNDVERVATSFFVSNFPINIDSSRLWKACESFGRLVDAYVAKKRSKHGYRFGFVRFLGVKDEELLTKSLRTIRLGDNLLFASVARFQRPSKSGRKHYDGEKKYEKPNFRFSTAISNKQENVKNDGKSNPRVTKHPGTEDDLKRSFASVVKGEVRQGLDPKGGVLKQVVLLDKDLVQIPDSSEAILVKIRDIETMINFKRICCEEGFEEITVSHVGGFWLWLQFKSVVACNTFKQNTYLQSLYSVLKSLSQNFIPDEIFVWVEINGLPLSTWGSNAFRKVISTIGKFQFFEKDKSSPMCMGRICIATRQVRAISEDIKVLIHSTEFMVHAHEVGTWNLELDNMSNDSSSSNEVNSDEELFEDDISDHSEPEVPVSKEDLRDASKKEQHVDEEESTHSNKEEGVETEQENKQGEKNMEEDMMESNIQAGLNEKVMSDNSLNSKVSKSSTSFTGHNKNHIRGVSVLYELDKIIEVGEKMGYDVKGYQSAFDTLINKIGVNMVDK